MDKESKGKWMDTEPYKGVRDFLPADMAIQKYMFGVMRKVVESYGYVEYGASVLEPADLYRSKSSEEIVNEQTYTFKDRGDREVTLRPEMTPTVARMIAGNRHDLSVPIRWYSIPNLFRYERPQRGRLREHWQLNVDMFGVSGIEADVEIISIAHDIMNAFGITDEKFIIHINDRNKVISELKRLVRNESMVDTALTLIDKREKITDDEFRKEWATLSDKPFAIFGDGTIGDIMGALEQNGIKNLFFNPYLVRGFTYYTGIVFEVFDKHESNKRSLFGGGRYDNLMDVFGKEKVPAVGFGMGDVTLRDVLETYNLLPSYKPSADIYLCHAGNAKPADLSLIAKRLRAQGVNVAIDLTEKKLGDQIKSADKQSIPFIIVIGDEEIASKAYKIKNLASGVEKMLPEIDITPETLK